MLAVLERGENRLFVEDYCSPRLVLAIKRGGITDEFVEMFRGSSEEMRASLRAAAAGSITVRRSGSIAHSSESFAGEPRLCVQGDNGKWFLEFTEQEYTPEVIYTLF